MKSLKGFNKSYFTFASILAHSVSQRIQNHITNGKKILQYRTSKELEDQEENDPPTELLNLIPITNLNKPCHCDCYFRKKTQIAVTLFKFIPRCPYYTTYFAFRRTGVHPPLNIL